METLWGAVVVLCISFVLSYTVLQIINYHKMQKHREEQRVARDKAETDKVVAKIKAQQKHLDQLRRENPEEYQRIKTARMRQKAKRSSRTRSSAERRNGSSTDNSVAIMNTATYSSTSSTWM